MSFVTKTKLNNSLTVGVLFFAVFLLNFYFIKLNNPQKEDVRVLAAYDSCSSSSCGVCGIASCSSTSGCTWVNSSCVAYTPTPTPANSAICDNHGNCGGSCGAATSCTPSSACGGISATCNGTYYPSYGCSTPTSCASGWTSTQPSSGTYSTCTTSCSCCNNSGPTCYKVIETACADLGGICYSSLNPAYEYTKVTGGYCATGTCYTSVKRPVCGGTCKAKTCGSYSTESVIWSDLSGDYCTASTPNCCTNYTKPNCNCFGNEKRPNGFVYISNTLSEGGSTACVPVTCVGTGIVTTTPTPIPTTANSCTPTNGYWSGWSSCSASCGNGVQTRSYNSATCGGSDISGSSTQICNLGCCPTSGSSSMCGVANGVTSSTTPTNLCSEGTASTVTFGSDVYSWYCYATAGSCGGYAGTDATCSAPRVQPPVLSGFEVRNTSNAVVQPENGGQNHICQAAFSNKTARFVVTATDPNGGETITSIQLRMGSSIYNPVSLLNGVAVFDIPYSSGNSTSTAVGIETNITDETNTSTGWVSVGRSFKFWDCQVPVNGTLYNGSLAVFEVIKCNSGSSDFITPVVSTVVYNLTYTGVNGDTDKEMTISSPSYNGGGNKLIWGAQYRPTFSNIDGNTPVMRNIGNGTCNYGSFVVDKSDEMGLDPYSSNPALTIDYSSILSQFAWYQVAGAGVQAKNLIANNIPNTCIDPCKANISISSTNSNDGLVAAQSITKGNGTYGETNNYGVSTNVIGTSYGYKYFYNEYYVKLTQGKAYGVGKSMSQIISENGGSGVIFVNGNFTIDTDNTVDLDTFFMVVASGDIQILPTVSSVQGIFISDGNIIASGTSDNQLNIQGTLYATENDIKFTRGFTIGTFNNRNPAVLITYRPDFIFSMPGKLTKILSGWKEGI